MLDDSIYYTGTRHGEDVGNITVTRDGVTPVIHPIVPKAKMDWLTPEGKRNLAQAILFDFLEDETNVPGLVQWFMARFQFAAVGFRVNGSTLKALIWAKLAD